MAHERRKKCVYFDPDTGQPMLTPLTGRIGCSRGPKCKYVHPTDSDWDSAIANWLFIDKLRPRSSIDNSVNGNNDNNDDNNSNWGDKRRNSVQGGSQMYRRPTPERLKRARAEVQDSHPNTVVLHQPLTGPSSSRVTSDVTKDPRKQQREKLPPTPFESHTPSVSLHSPQQHKQQPPSDISSRIIDHQTSPARPSVTVESTPAMDIDPLSPSLPQDPITTIDHPSGAKSPLKEASSDSLRENIRIEAMVKQSFLQMSALLKLHGDLQAAKRERAYAQKISELLGNEIPKQHCDDLERADGEISRMNSDVEKSLRGFSRTLVELFTSITPVGSEDKAFPGGAAQDHEMAALRKEVVDYINATCEDVDNIRGVLEDHQSSLVILNEALQIKAENPNTQANESWRRDVTNLGASVSAMKTRLDTLEADMSHLKDQEELPDELGNLEKRVSLLTEREPQFDQLERRVELMEQSISTWQNSADDSGTKFQVLSSKVDRIESALMSTSESTRNLDALVRDSIIKEVKDFRVGLEQAIKDDKLRAEELLSEKQKRIQLQNLHEELLKKVEVRNAEMEHLLKSMSKLEANMQQQVSTTDILANRVDALVRGADPKLNAFLKQTEERISSQFLPDILLRILKQQEENVVQKLIPRLDPMFRLVEEIYSLTTPGASVGHDEATRAKIGNGPVQQK